MSADLTAAPSSTVGLETLEATPTRALTFLRAVGTHLAIRATLLAHGYTDADHQEGWALLHAASGFGVGTTIDAIDADVRDAIRALDTWDEDGFRIVSATFQRRFPTVADKVLAGIGPSNGSAAVVGVSTLLDRLDALSQSQAPDDQAAIALLSKRGIDAAERTRLRALVAKAQSVDATAASDLAAAQASQQANAQRHLAALAQLRGWYEEWSDIARATVKRRDYLIRLGLAARRSPKKPEPKPADGAAGVKATG